MIKFISGLTWLLVYRTEKYQKLKADVDRQCKKCKSVYLFNFLTIIISYEKPLLKSFIIILELINLFIKIETLYIYHSFGPIVSDLLGQNIKKFYGRSLLFEIAQTSKFLFFGIMELWKDYQDFI